jgi:hypothetical protein
MDVHPYAAAFPMMSDDELDALADDIKANGLRHPVIVDVDGRLIDGRNRLAACERAGLEPHWETLPGNVDAVDFIVSINVERRHLSTGQRAMARALALVEQGKRRNGRWSRGSVDISDSRNSNWRQSLAQAGVVLDETPGAARLVLSGDLTLNAAHRDADKIRQARDAVDQAAVELPMRIARLREVLPDLAGRVVAGEIEIDAAEKRLADYLAAEREANRQINQWLGTAIERLAGFAVYPDNVDTLIKNFDHRDTLAFHDRPISPADVAVAARGLLLIAERWETGR